MTDAGGEMVFAASIVFTAHNRRDMLLAAVDLAKRQTVPVEIIVMDDCSTDGTAGALGAAHPDVTCVRSAISLGPCYQRNRGVEHASCEVVFLLDDDSMLVDATTVERSLADLDAAPEAAVLAIPFRNVLQDAVTWHRRSRSDRRQVTVDFAACAHAVRRTTFLSVGGYYERFFYIGEEGDLALRLLAIGRHVELGTAPPIEHLQSPARRSYRAAFYGRRNDVLFYVVRAPLRRLPLRLAGTVAKGLRFGWRIGCMRATVAGLGAGLAQLGTRSRAPVSVALFDLFLWLKTAPPIGPAELHARLGRQPG